MRVIVSLCLLLLFGCTSASQAPPTETPAPAPPSARATATTTPGRASVVAVAAPAAPTVEVGHTLGAPPSVENLDLPANSCTSKDGLPDPKCTPGVLNPSLKVQQLCDPKFTTVPIRAQYAPVAYTDALKRKQMIAYGFVGTNPDTGKAWSPADVEEDHLVALEDGGHPNDPRNLWPQPRASAHASGYQYTAEAKDQVETAVKKALCADQPMASIFQARLALDWRQFLTTTNLPAGVTLDTSKEAEP